MERVNLFFLHGFLGRPSDWSRIRNQLESHGNVRFFIPDYFNHPELNPTNTLDQWADHFIHWVEAQGCAGERNVLVGYSLGGRLALHALEKNSALWDQVIVISANPGLEGDLEREMRRDLDSTWAGEFLKSPWDLVLKKWNSQFVFEGSQKEPVRLERDYSRELLSLALTKWSLANQQDKRPVIQEHVKKVRWIVGERDSKYVELSRRLADQVPGLIVERIPAASHRVLFDCSDTLGDRLWQILSQAP